jgi:excinuclease UvrABC nuclease subunit
LFETKYLYYVGKTKRDFRTRYSEYLDDAAGKGKPRSRVYKMLKLWEDHLHFYYANISLNADIDDSEAKLLDTFVPKVNILIPIAKIKPELKEIYV